MVSRIDESYVSLFSTDSTKAEETTLVTKPVASVVKIEPLTSDIKLLSLKIQHGSVSFQAGQFIGMYDGRDSHDGEYIFPGTFSIASRPSELPIIRFAIGCDQNPRNLRHCLYYNAKVGDSFYFDEFGSGTVAVTPQMVMTPVGGPGSIMLIGGGSAVMGLVSVVEELLHDEAGRKIPQIKLLHSNRSNQDIPFHQRMLELATEYSAIFRYKLFVTGKVESHEVPQGQLGRIGHEDLAKEIAGVRLFCVCGSGIFCEAIVDMLLDLGVWPGSIRTDYTTRIDPSRQLVALKQTTAGNKVGRFQNCMDGTQEKGGNLSSSDYLNSHGIESLLENITNRLEVAKPDKPLSFIVDEIERMKEKLPEVANTKAADPDFWINYWETDKVTWHAPVVSPWLETHIGACAYKGDTIFVPLCGKTIDMKFLLDHGYSVVGADCSGIACMDFFAENSIPDYERKVVAHAEGKHIVCHMSTSVPLRLFEGDLFNLTPDIVGHVDCILDRAALVALHPNMIEDEYVPLMLSLLRPGGKVLFASVSELPFPKAPPHIYKQDQIESILEKFFSCFDLLETHRYRVNAGFVSEPIYLLHSKLSEQTIFEL